jgi:hypothetical protein
MPATGRPSSSSRRPSMTSGDPSEYASLALQMITNGYFNGETVRLDGGIRMAPR